MGDDRTGDRETVAKRLRRWGLCESTVRKFQEIDITEDLLLIINDELLIELISDPLERLRFKINLKKDFATSDSNEPRESSEESETCEIATAGANVSIVDVDVADLLSSEDLKLVVEIPPAANDVEQRVTPTPVSTSHGAGGQSPHCRSDYAELDLIQLLEATAEGQALCNIYKEKKELRDRDRDFIASIIIDHELRGHLDTRISSERFCFLGDQIVKSFPTETKCTWVLIDRFGKFVTGKGKLYSRWTNTRRKYMKSGVIPGGRKGRRAGSCGRWRQSESDAGDLNEDQVSGISEDKQDVILWLQNNDGPWATITEKWKETSNERRRIILQTNVGVGEYLKQYPVFKKHDRAYELLEMDFDSEYPDSSKKLYAAWPKLRSFAIKKLPKAQAELAASIVDPAAQITYVLIHMSKIFRVVTARKQTKTVPNWRPSKVEMQEAFLLHVKVIGDLDVKLNERRDRLKRFGCQLQPTAAIVGPTFDQIEQCFVNLDGDIRYEVESPLKAVDVVFKSMHALDAQYPPEAHSMWQFVQRAIYELPHNKQFDTYCGDLEKLMHEYAHV